MADVDVTPITAAGDIGNAATTLVWTTLDGADVNRFGPIQPGRGLLVMIHNPTGGALNMNLTQVANKNNRGGAVATTVESIGAGLVAVRGPFTRSDGWASTSGNLGVQCSADAGLKGLCLYV